MASVSKSVGAEGIRSTHHPDRSWLNKVAMRNIHLMSLTLEVSQPNQRGSKGTGYFLACKCAMESLECWYYAKETKSQCRGHVLSCDQSR